MLEEELITIWKSSPNQEQIKFEKSRLILEVQSSLVRLNRAIKYRDLSEIGTGLVLIPLLAHAAYTVPHILSKIGGVLGLLWCAYVIYRLMALKKHKPDNLAETYKDHLIKNRKYLEVQKNMKETALFWYILPSSTAAMLFFLGFLMNNPEKEKTALTLIAISFLLGVFIYFYNASIIKNKYAPQIENIDKLIRTIEE